jgi:DNA-directed RNA polymerase omega subunit
LGTGERTLCETDAKLELKHFMARTNETTETGSLLVTNEEQWPGIDSSFRLIVVAALRCKQLQRGALPRIEADARRHRNTSIALEEVKQGLVAFTVNRKDPNGNGADPPPPPDK